MGPARYGVTAGIVYGALSLAELPVLYALVTVKGTEWLTESERHVRQAIGLSHGDDDLLLRGENLGTRLGAVFVLHKALIVVRVPITAVLTKRLGRASARHHVYNGRARARMAQTQTQPPNPKALANMGTPPSKRSKWMSLFF